MSASSGRPIRPIEFLSICYGRVVKVGCRVIVQRFSLLVPAVLVSLVAAAHAQFATKVTEVEVYATVTDANGPVIGLQERDFEVLEDGVPQSITTFAAGDFPMSLALAIDRSVSMAGTPLALAKAAGVALLRQLRENDRVMVIAVASDVEVVSPLGADRRETERALLSLQPWSSTALNDAVVASIDLLQQAGGRRALILLSDGIDRYSTATAADALSHARASDVLVYPIALGKSPSALFAELSAETGGRSFLIADARALDSTFGAIADELRHQYLLGYAPRRPIDAQRRTWRAIQVRVDRAGVRVRARDGYVAR